jgi:hypothetical protein
MSFEIAVRSDGADEEFEPELPKMLPIDEEFAAKRMKSLLGKYGSSNGVTMSDKQRQEELMLLVTQLTGEVPEVEETF